MTRFSTILASCHRLPREIIRNARRRARFAARRARVAFDSDRDGVRGVYVAMRDGTSVTRVTGAECTAIPTWSPDATRLAFVRAEADRPDV